MSTQNEIELVYVDSVEALPSWLSRDALARAFHEKMEPYNDSLEDVQRALDYGLNVDTHKDGGFCVLAVRGEQLMGAVLMLRTGMSGYIPPWLLLMIYVDPAARGQGIGSRLIDDVRQRCDGDIKLHVEHDNPAKRLYERKGFRSKYLEMRMPNPK